MADGKIITTEDGKIVFSGGPDCADLAGAVAFDRALKCCTFGEQRGIYVHPNFSGYPLSTYKAISYDHQCIRLLIYCPTTLANPGYGCQGYVNNLSSPTYVFRYSECRTGPASYSDWHHLWRHACDADKQNCLKLGPTLGACSNPDFDPVTKLLPARPPYYWPSCCEPVDFRPTSQCTCMEEIGAADLLWLPDTEDIQGSVDGLPCLPRCDGAADEAGTLYRGSECGPEQFMFYIWLEYVTAHVMTRAKPSTFTDLGLYAVNLLGGGIVRGWACAKPFDCETGNSEGCS